MKTIYKFPIAITDDQAVLMPASADILSAQFQGDTLCLWALLDTTEKKTARLIYIFGTGHPVPRRTDLRFIDTVQAGRLVWHVFELR